MALLRNGTLLQQYPIRQFGGGVAADRSMFTRADRLNVFSALPRLAAHPSGMRPPVAWIMPISAGAMASRNEGAITVSGEAEGALGRSIEGAGVVTIGAAGSGSLIISMVGVGSVSVGGDAIVSALLEASGSGTLSVGGTGTIGALGFLEGNGAASVVGALVSYAIGYMASDYTPFSELSAEGLARAVWSSAASANNTAGSMGEKVNAAGAAGDPLLGEIEDGETLRETMRLLRAVLLGDGAGLEGSTMTFKSKDGTITRVTATYNAGARTITLVDAS